MYIFYKIHNMYIFGYLDIYLDIFKYLSLNMFWIFEDQIEAAPNYEYSFKEILYYILVATFLLSYASYVSHFKVADKQDFVE